MDRATPSRRNGTRNTELGLAVAALREMILAGERYRLATATHLNITVTDSQAVSYLLARGEMGQHELARALDMTTGSVTSLVDRLAARGLIERRPHRTDRRRWIIRLSTAGENALAEIKHWMSDAFDGFTADQLTAVSGHLNHLATALRRRTDAVPASAPADAEPLRRRR